jgi:hypothetical protein
MALSAPVATAQYGADARPPWPPRGYACVRTSSSPTIDGRIDPGEWAAGAWSEPFVDILGDRKPAPRHATRMRMMWDDEFLYVGASLEEPHVWATLTARDSVIYHDNDFEVFIDPSGDTHLYNEIEINALNTVWDLLLVKTYDDGGPAIHAWDIPELRTAVHIDGTINDPTDTDTGWSVEMAIPWAALAETAGVDCPPKPGDRWRMNFSRVQWRLDVNDGAYIKRADEAGDALPEDNWVWSEQRAIAMHEPEFWGIVEFRSSPNGPSVEPTDADRAMWCLRQVFRAVRAYAQAHGKPPMQLDEVDDYKRLVATCEPPAGWNWPPTFTGDGDRWRLWIEQPDSGPSINVMEDGKTTRGQ